MAQKKKILITGATGAIGGALATAYAQEGVVLHLHGRNPEALRDIATHCQTLGADVIRHTCDLRDAVALEVWLAQLNQQGAFDLVILNAGVNTNIGKDKAGEPWVEVEALLDINIKAVMKCVHHLLPAMRQSGAGQIALVSSLAGYFGLPVTPSYCASKAALKAYGEALRGWLAPEGIKVNVIMPGYVESPMCRGMPGPKLFLWTAERAGYVIQRGLAKNKARISFPFPLNWGTWWLAVLPAAISSRLVRLMGYVPK